MGYGSSFSPNLALRPAKTRAFPYPGPAYPLPVREELLPPRRAGQPTARLLLP